MKVRAISIIAFLAFSIASNAEENCIQGTVDIDPALLQSHAGSDKSALFVYIRELGRESGIPTAVITIDNPAYPQDFSLCGDDQMMRGVKARTLDESYKVFARHSPTGVPMKKEGFVGDSLGPGGKGVRAGEKVSLTINRQYGN